MLCNKIILTIAMLLIAASVPALALTSYDVLTGTLGSVDVWSEATESGGIWTYTYDLLNRTGNLGDIHVFVVDNPPPSAYDTVWNDSGFSDPSWPTNVMLEWLDGSIAIGAHGHFRYMSETGPDMIKVDALAVNSGTYASGYTLGMAASIPEPSCLATLGSFLTLSAVYLRRRRR